jgi:Uncharacterized protein conserved in bacteria
MSKHPRITPYLTVRGGLDAIRFYEEAFDAEVDDLVMAEDGKTVIHARLEIDDAEIMLCDDTSQHATGTAAPHAPGSASVTLYLDLKKAKQVDRMIEQAEKAGATVLAPAADVDWGARYGRVRDPFGHVWSFGAPIKKKHKYASDKTDDGDRDDD